MKAKFEGYSLDLQEVLIGTPRAPAGYDTIENILIQLRSRQVAREQIETYQEQEKAAIQERALNEAKATAAAQTALTQSLIQVKVNENEGSAALARAQKDAETRKVTAAAVGEQSRLEGQGEADRVLAVGAANAQATKLAVDAYGGPRIPSRGAELCEVRGSPDQDQSAPGAAVPDVRQPGQREHQRRPDPDRDVELDVRPDDARRPGKAEGRGAERRAPDQRFVIDCAARLPAVRSTAGSLQGRLPHRSCRFPPHREAVPIAPRRLGCILQGSRPKRCTSQEPAVT